MNLEKLYIYKVRFIKVNYCMTLPISSLANMEYMLYGGMLGANPNCPSYANGYMASNNMYSNMYNPYVYNNYAMPGVNGGVNGVNGGVSGINNTSAPASANNTDIFTQASADNKTVQQDLDTLGKFYEDGQSMVQTWGSLPMAAGMIAFTENPQAIKHFWNSSKAIGVTNKVFDMKNPAIKALWEKNPVIMQRAYGQMHAINRAAESKLPVIGGWFKKQLDGQTREALEKRMKEALKTGDMKTIARATEELKASRYMDGAIPTGWRKLKKSLGFKVTERTPLSQIDLKKAQIDKGVEIATASKCGFGGLVKQGLKEGKTFALFSTIIELPKIISAYQNGGTSAALTQTAQTGIRAAADGIGWTLGRAAGTAIGTKVGAAIGTAVCPGLGTAVGAILGFVGGAAGSILASKITHKLMPTDKATELEAKKLKSTPEGQSQLLTMVLQKAQAGEKIPDNVAQAALRLTA